MAIDTRFRGFQYATMPVTGPKTAAIRPGNDADHAISRSVRDNLENLQRTADELLESKNFGMTSLTEVRDKLRQYGLALRGD